jgi:hypothetical protein
VGNGGQIIVLLCRGFLQGTAKHLGRGLKLIESRQTGALHQHGFDGLLLSAIAFGTFLIAIGILLQDGIVTIQQLALQKFLTHLDAFFRMTDPLRLGLHQQLRHHVRAQLQRRECQTG